uniref:Uncharacterized protein n=1 Tax=Vespula pensylvanica TaxID=30213 RepID=A0A834NJ64_VESPE|nr:hypothetical protein H0235_013567 [Vespula pensylvanica]
MSMTSTLEVPEFSIDIGAGTRLKARKAVARTYKGLVEFVYGGRCTADTQGLYTDSEFSGRSTLKEMSFPQSLLPSFSLPLPKLFELFHDKEVHKCGSVPAVLTDRTYLQTNSSLVTSISFLSISSLEKPAT